MRKGVHELLVRACRYKPKLLSILGILGVQILLLVRFCLPWFCLPLICLHVMLLCSAWL